MLQKGVELIIEFDPACKDTWERINQMENVIQKHKYSKILTPLIHQCALRRGFLLAIFHFLTKISIFEKNFTF